MNNEKTENTIPELEDDALDQVGGGSGQNSGCPECHSTNPRTMKGNDYVCPDCGYVLFTRPGHLGIF